MEELFRSPESISRTIMLILAPAVMISACCLLVGGLSTRTNIINDRLRALNRERLDLIRNFANLALSAERLAEIDYQLPDLRRRLLVSNRALLAAYSAILIFVSDMLLIALAALTGSVLIAIIALVIFLTATTALGLAAIFTIQEVRSSMRAVLFEVDRVSGLAVEMKEAGTGHQFEAGRV
jgi:hypothetical protein